MLMVFLFLNLITFYIANLFQSISTLYNVSYFYQFRCRTGAKVRRFRKVKI